MTTIEEGGSHNLGFDIDLTGLEFLKYVLQTASTTSPQPICDSLPDKTPSEKLCVAIDENQMALADAKSCRYLASANTSVCRTFFLRNPKTSATLVTHLNYQAQEGEFLEAIKRIAQRGEELDMYITGGAARCDYGTEEAYLSDMAGKTLNIKESRIHTVKDIEETLDNINALAERLDIKINIKVVNLCSAKQTMNSVVDVITGNYFYVSNEVIKPFIIAPHSSKEYEENIRGPISTVFNGLQNIIHIT